MFRSRRMPTFGCRPSLRYFALFCGAYFLSACEHELEVATSKKRSPGGAMVNSQRGGLCSATLIAPRVLLTAAHCLFDGENKPLDVQRDFTYFTLSKAALEPEDEASAVVVDYVLHPGYADTVPVVEAAGPHKRNLQAYISAAMQAECGPLLGENSADQSLWSSGNVTEQMLREEEAYIACQRKFTLDLAGPRHGSDMLYDTHDIALVFVDRTIADVQMARLPTYSYESAVAGKSFTVASYGTRFDPVEKVDVVGLQHGGELDVNKTSLFEMEVSGRERVLCPGDSGGGLFDVEANGSLEIVGVNVRTLLMPFSHRCTGPSVATRVAPYVAWIEDTLHGRL